ncbi:MAG: alpha/beta fold hydrolase [Chloroflexi bacterium]|nr:alpha/beta fold hydrolase [Chloroflexota bacterium]
MRRIIFYLLAITASALALAFFFDGSAVGAASPRHSTREILARLGGAPCPDSEFTCVTVTAPLDHFNPADPRTLDVVFAVLPATGTRKGMFVTATGGPGSAGIGCCADYYTSFFARGITEHFDIVFFDQRGIGLSGGLTCPTAAAIWYRQNWRGDTAARWKKLRNAAQRFADDCDTESGASPYLKFLGTKQAVEDLDAFRALMGDDKFWLYGESYGTQYAQTYANAHAAHLTGMILDGTVDLTLDGMPYYANAVQSFNDTLVAALDTCEANASCAADFGMDPRKAYDQLAAQLRAQRRRVAFPLGTGKRVTRGFGFGDLESVGVGEMYGESGRMLFVRALAAYARSGDLVPLTRLLYPNLGVDEQTLQPIPDDTWSDVIYYGVECQDYGYFSGDVDTSATNFFNGARPVEDSGLRLASLIWGDLPCVYWRDSSSDATRPPHWRAPGVPTLVLNALADPITPINSARAVYENLDDAYLITQRGGPHVIFGRGVKCVDNLVNAFLISDIVPPQRETECPGQVTSAYVPLAPLAAREFASPLQALQSAETEIYYLPEFWYWDYATPTRVGCADRGTLQFRAQGDLIKFDLKDCAFTNGFEMTGTGYYDSAHDRFWLQVKVAGAQTCQLKYERVGDTSSVKGACAGARVRLAGANVVPIPTQVQEKIPVRPAKTR